MYKRIIFTTLILVIIGLIFVYSSSHIWAQYKFNDTYYFIKRQALFACIGTVIMLIVSKIDYRIYKKYAYIFLIISLILMVLVLIPGIGMVRGGSRSWFNLGVFALQPSECLKLSLIIFSAYYIEKNYYKMKHIISVLPLLSIIMFSFFLIMLQPDFGSGVVMVCGVIVMIVVSPFLFKYFMILGGVGILGITIMILSAPYRMKRILSFLNPFEDPLGSGFQAIQSLYAIGPGGLLGVGFNNSIQKHFYLPEPQTDFIFAIIAEEMGFLGCLFIIFLYYYLFSSVIKLAMNSKDMFSSLLALGLISTLGIQTLINLGVVVGLFPVTGVTLPFISYGGTSLMMTMISIGIILNIARRYK